MEGDDEMVKLLCRRLADVNRPDKVRNMRLN